MDTFPELVNSSVKFKIRFVDVVWTREREKLEACIELCWAEMETLDQSFLQDFLTPYELHFLLHGSSCFLCGKAQPQFRGPYVATEGLFILDYFPTKE